MNIKQKVSNSPKWTVGATVFWLGGATISLAMSMHILDWVSLKVSYSNFEKYFMIAAVTISYVHFLLVYSSIDDMETKKDLFQKRFPNWFGTGLEVFLRTLAIILMVAASGELAYLSLSTFHQFLWSITSINWSDQSAIQTFKAASLEFYSISLAAMFFILLCWDILSVIKKPTKNTRSENNQEDRCSVWSYLAGFMENYDYLISDFLAVLIWAGTSLLITNIWGKVGGIVNGVGLLILFYFIVVVARTIDQLIQFKCSANHT